MKLAKRVDLSVRGAMTILAAQWKAASPEVRQKYEILAAEGKKVANEVPERRRPLSAYNFFMKEQLLNRPNGESVPSMMKKLGGRWKALDTAARKPYEDMAVEAKKEHFSGKKTEGAWNSGENWIASLGLKKRAWIAGLP